MNDIMVDLETMGTTADAVIISIGAVKFDLTSDAVSDEGFYASISVESNLDYGRRISEDTLVNFWMDDEKTGNGARSVFKEPKQGIDDAFDAFAKWVDRPDYRIWSNGANFDEPILAHAFTQLRMPIPWKFWNVRCVRTFKNLPGAKDVVVPRVGVHHNALADALTQAALVQQIYRKLFIKMKVRAIA
jgi:hypothetical protein